MLVYQRVNLHFPMGFPMFSHFPMGFDTKSRLVLPWAPAETWYTTAVQHRAYVA